MELRKASFVSYPSILGNYIVACGGVGLLQTVMNLLVNDSFFLNVATHFPRAGHQVRRATEYNYCICFGGSCFNSTV